MEMVWPTLLRLAPVGRNLGPGDDPATLAGRLGAAAVEEAPPLAAAALPRLAAAVVPAPP